ncbi:hypothetical protein WFJ11_06170 [Parvimonas micra]|uniref:hypothetical protein n=1 Tax=Parvimonas micra TaxID=33033 RepID=UPI0030D1BEF4
MCNLFFKYFIKQKKNILFLIILLILGFGTSSISKFENYKNIKKQIEINMSVIEDVKLSLEYFKQELKEGKLSEEDKKLNEEYQKDYIKIIKNRSEMIDKIENLDWEFLYVKELESLKDSDGNFTIIDLNNDLVKDYHINKLTVEVTFETLTYLKKYNIPSAHPLFLEKTEFEQPRTSEESNLLDYYSKKTLIGTSHRLWDFFTNNLVLIYTFIIVVTFGILFSKLEESQNKTIRFLRISGASKFRVVSSGLFTGGILTIILGLLIPTIFFGIEFLINGSSSFKYPITTYIVKSDYFSLMSFGYKIVPISDVLIKSLILFLLYGIFVFLITSTISTFVKSSVKSVILSFGLIATLQMFNKWYNPFSYWRVGKIADGSINFLFKTITYSFDKSCKILIIVICILTILLICIAFIQDRRRNGYA